MKFLIQIDQLPSLLEQIGTEIVKECTSGFTVEVLRHFVQLTNTEYFQHKTSSLLRK